MNVAVQPQLWRIAVDQTKKRLEADVRLVVAVSEPERRGVGYEDLRTGLPKSLRRQIPADRDHARRHICRSEYWLGP